MVWCCVWKVFCHWAGYLWDQSSQITMLHFYMSSMCSCFLVFTKLFLHYFYQTCSFSTVFSNWLELCKIIYFLIVLFTETGGKFALLLKWKSWRTNVTFSFIFESDAIFSNCVIPLVCWVQSEEDELELVSLGYCLMRERKMLNVFYYSFLTVVSLHFLNNSSVPLVADKNTFVLSNLKPNQFKLKTHPKSRTSHL